MISGLVIIFVYAGEEEDKRNPKAPKIPVITSAVELIWIRYIVVSAIQKKPRGLFVGIHHMLVKGRGNDLPSNEIDIVGNPLR